MSACTMTPRYLGKSESKISKYQGYMYIFVCKINAAEEGRKAESYDKFKIAFLIIYGKLEIVLIYK
jgi:hypothetical protein